MKATVVYYTDGHADPRILGACRKQLARCAAEHNMPIICVSQEPTDFGLNIVMGNLGRSVESMFRQILRGLEECEAEIVFLAEHDVLYHPSHFAFEPPNREDRFWYNRNMWHVSAIDGKAVYYLHNDPSHLCAHRDLLLKHYGKVVAMGQFQRRYGFSPPRGLPEEEQVGRHGTWMSEYPNIDIRHSGAFTRQRMTREQFSSPRVCRRWTEADEVPWWGRTKDRFWEFLADAERHSVLHQQCA